MGILSMLIGGAIAYKIFKPRRKKGIGYCPIHNAKFRLPRRCLACVREEKKAMKSVFMTSQRMSFQLE